MLTSLRAVVVVKTRHYRVWFTRNGGFGGGFGGVDNVEIEYDSVYRAKSAANLLDARAAFRRKYGYHGSICADPDTCELVS